MNSSQDPFKHQHYDLIKLDEDYIEKIFRDIESVLQTKKTPALAKILRSLADVTRLKIVALAKSRGKLYEFEVVGAFKLAQPTASYHLRMLFESGVLIKKREGKMIAYMPSNNAAWKLAEMVLIVANNTL